MCSAYTCTGLYTPDEPLNVPAGQPAQADEPAAGEIITVAVDRNHHSLDSSVPAHSSCQDKTLCACSNSIFQSLSVHFWFFYSGSFSTKLISAISIVRRRNCAGGAPLAEICHSDPNDTARTWNTCHGIVSTALKLVRPRYL